MRQGYMEKFGFSTGAFIPTEKHPKQKLLRNPAATISAILGTAYAIAQVAGLQDKQRLPHSRFKYWICRIISKIY